MLHNLCLKSYLPYGRYRGKGVKFEGRQQEAKREDLDVETEVARIIDEATRDADDEASRPVPFADASFSRARDSLTITRPAARPEPTKNSWFSSKKTAPASRF